MGYRPPSSNYEEIGMDIDKAFDEFTEMVMIGTRCEISCKKGLWGTSAPTKEQALSEAKHYFWQYYSDGEYDA
jgi:hypothetical protein